MIRSRRNLFAIPLLIGLCALLGGSYGGRVKATEPGDDEIEQNLRLLSKVYAAVEENYAEPVDPEKAIYNGAIQGMIRTLDPHSNFVDPRAFKTLKEDRRGRYYGVGMLVTQRAGHVMVLVPYEGSPAYRAGLRPGDIIVRVDDHPTENSTTTEVADLLKGPKGTQVHVAVLREGSPQPLEFDLVRDEIPRPSVDLSYEVRPGIGYMRITTFFSEATGREAAAALRRLDPKHLKGLILDLRGNTGGLLSEAVSVADLFLARNQVIVSHRGRSSPEKVFKAAHGNGGIEYPLVVLIDRHTASASEIVAGAIQDHDRGLVAGETSFGKGLVQNEYPLSENAGLLLTIARYYTPSGRLIQRKFTGVSLYDYYYARDDGENGTGSGQRQARWTDSGRRVYGGGGITPDEKVSPPSLPPLLRLLDYQKYAFFNFARYYLGSHKTIPRDFEVNDEVLGDFRRFLDREKVTFGEKDFAESLEVIKRRIKRDLFVSAFGKTEGDRVAVEGDYQVQRAIELLPRAKALCDNARRIVARHFPAQ